MPLPKHMEVTPNLVEPSDFFDRREFVWECETQFLGENLKTPALKKNPNGARFMSLKKNGSVRTRRRLKCHLKPNILFNFSSSSARKSKNPSKCLGDFWP